MLKKIGGLFKKVFGSKLERDLKKLQPIVDLVNSLEILYFDMTDEELILKTDYFINLIENGIEDDYTENLFLKIKSQIEKLQKLSEKDVDDILLKFKTRLLSHKNILNEKYKNEKMLSVITNSFSDKRINKMMKDFETRLIKIKKMTKDELSYLKSTFLNSWKTYLNSISGKEILDIILPEAFSVVREASMRHLGLRHFDVQIIGGAVLHQGKIAEMKTGEGKTLVATLSVYLNSLTSKGVHVVTVNEYLAKRDSIWMGELYLFLNRTVGLIYNNMSQSKKKEAYNCDITFGTNNEFGFDYLRDNMAVDIDNCVQREYNYAIIDEVDSILIDEARTPLIISGQAEDSTDKYYKINRIVPHLKKGERIEEGEEIRETGDFWVDEKSSQVTLTEQGITKCEKILNISNLYSPQKMDVIHLIIQALRAHHLFKKDTDYIVKDGEVLIVDEFTGRLMPGRRWSDGLHQAIEAKEGVNIESESQTLATITLQNYFRMYKKLSGMTGTADTEASEFWEIYKLDVVVIPTNLPLAREDLNDSIYRTKDEKYNAVAEIVKESYIKGRPVLVGTISIEVSELLSQKLKKLGVKHNVLNAKYHEKEADIIAMAGQKKAVTIATNMAGRGTDIVLEDGVIDLGGLCVLGTERHESRRIDNQLRGRSGRQGDPGTTKFFVALEDDLMRLFGSERISGMMKTLGMENGQEIQHPFITRAIERAQKKVEERNFDIRKHLIDFDNVMNDQRNVIYKWRREVLTAEKMMVYAKDIFQDIIEESVFEYCPEKVDYEKWDIKGLLNNIYKIFGVEILQHSLPENCIEHQPLYNYINDIIEHKYMAKIENPIFEQFQKPIILSVIDAHWKDHLYNLDNLKEGIYLRGWASKDPVVEYKNESMAMFNQMIYSVKKEISNKLFHAKFSEEDTYNFLFNTGQMDYEHNQIDTFKESKNKRKKSKSNKVVGIKVEKIGRNDPCPCGSGKKYKKCCGKKV